MHEAFLPPSIANSIGRRRLFCIWAQEILKEILSFIRIIRPTDIFRTVPVQVDRASDLDPGSQTERRMVPSCWVMPNLRAIKGLLVSKRTQLSRNRLLIPPPCPTPKENRGASCGHVHTEYRTNQSFRYGSFTSEYPREHKSKRDGPCTRKPGKMESRAFRQNETKLQVLLVLAARRTAIPNRHRPFSQEINCTKSGTMPRKI